MQKHIFQTFAGSLLSLRRLATRGLLAGLALVALPSAAPPAMAQDQASDNQEEGGLICVEIGIGWSGTPAEVKEIKTTPVPASFLSILNAGGCSSWQLMKTSLLDWHIRHGDEQSAQAAVRFLELRFSASLESGFPDEFATVWEKAVRDGQKYLDQRQITDEDFTGANWHREVEPAVMSLKSVRRLRDIAERLESAELIAGEYTRAADALLSRSLLKEARRVHGPASTTIDFIGEREELGGLEAIFARRFRPGFRTDRLSTPARDIVLAVTEALLIRDEATIRAAQEVTQQYFNPSGDTFPMPDLHTFLDFAYEGDDKACIADQLNSREGYMQRCEDDNLEHFAFIFWYQRARLELLASEEGVILSSMRASLRPRDHTKSVIDLFIRRAWYDGTRYGEEDAPPEATRLLIGLAKERASKLATPCRKAQGEDGREDSRTMYQSLEAISHALELASPSSQPELYREVAEARIELHNIYEACGAEAWEPQYKRDLILSRSYLEQYEDLIEVE